MDTNVWILGTIFIGLAVLSFFRDSIINYFFEGLKKKIKKETGAPMEDMFKNLTGFLDQMSNENPNDGSGKPKTKEIDTKVSEEILHHLIIMNNKLDLLIKISGKSPVEMPKLEEIDGILG